MTAAHLQASIAGVRAVLERHSVKSGDRIVIVTANERESVFAYHATGQLGAVAVLTHVSAGVTELATACSASSPRLVLLSPAAATLRASIDGSLTVVDIGDIGDTDTVNVQPGDVQPGETSVHLDHATPRVVVFTSGTTSSPKGVIHTRASLRSAVANFHAMTDLGQQDRIFLVSPLASITGLLQALELAPAIGATIVLESSWDEEKSLDFLLSTQATFYGGPDLVLDRLLQAAARRGRNLPLRLAALGGTMLRRELVTAAEHSGIRVVRVYGSSEAPCSSGTRPHEPASLRLFGEGIAGPDVELRIADDDSRELLVRGPHLFQGYLDPADNEDALIGGWYHTGDAAEVVEGRLQIVGRLKEIASRNGKKISLAEVEQAFARASGLAECAAFAVDDPQTGERVSIAVRLDTSDEPDVEFVLQAMQDNGLARWKLPECVVRISGPLPMTATGKVQRRALFETPEVIWRASRLPSPP